MPGLRPTVIGSYPQPAWLVDRERLMEKIVPRVRAEDIWRVSAEHLEQAQDDATLLAIRDQERAGLDEITDGEMRRESYSNRFGTALGGIDLENPAQVTVQDFQMKLPRVVGPLTRPSPVELSDLRFLKANTDRATKITLPGPFTLSKQAVDEYYGDPEALAMAYAEIVREEAKDLAAEGVDVIQLDEPWLRQDPDGANRYAVRAIETALAGIDVTTAIHLCFGYGFVVGPDKPKAYAFLEGLADTCVDQISVEAAQAQLDLGVFRNLSTKTILLGVLDLSHNRIEADELVAARIRSALPFISADRLVPAPDCGMKYLSRAAAFGKLQTLVRASAKVSRELAEA